MVFSICSAPAAGTGGFSFGTALGTAAATPASTTGTTPSLGLGGSLFAQKPAGGFSFNTPASSNDVTHETIASIAINVLAVNIAANYQ